MLLPSLEEPYNDIYQGIADALDMNNYILVLKLTQNNIVLENHFLEQLLCIGMVGAIMVPCDQKNKKKYEELQNQGIKIVMVERKLEGIDFSNVLFENKQLIFDITNTLIEENPCREIRLMVGKKEFSNEQDCVEGYLAAREDHEEDIIVIEETRKEAIFDRIYQKLIENGQYPECVITSSMEFATHLSEVCNIIKIKIEIHAIVGEKWYTTDLYKDITQYGRNAILMGKEAGKLLASIMKSRAEIENRSIYIRPKTNYRNTEIEFHSQPMRSLRVLAFQCDATDALEKLSCAFRNITGIQVEFNKLEYSPLRRELYSQTRGKKTDYDIVMMDLPWIRSILSENYLENIKGWVKKDDLLANYPSGIRQDFYRGDCGVHLLPIIATIQALPSDVIEAAVLDGCTGLRKVRYIIVPMIWQSIVSSIVIIVTAVLKTFDLVYVMTSGGPNGLTDVPSTLLYKQAFKYSNFGRASAIGVILFILSVLCTILSLRITKREAIEY